MATCFNMLVQRPVKWGPAFVFVLAMLLAHGARATVPEIPRLRVLGIEHGLPSSFVNGIVEDRDGYIWIATNDGLARYDGASMQVWRHDPDDPESLPGNLITFIHVDARNRLWVAVEARGLSVLGPDRKGFRHYRMDDSTQGGEQRIGSNDVFTIDSHGDDIWFGTYGGGLHHLDAAGRITRFMPREGDETSLPEETITTIAFDQEGVLWIGTFAGLVRWDGGQDFERVPLPGESEAPVILSVTSREDGIWVGATTGLFRRTHEGQWDTPSWSTMFAHHNVVLTLVNDRDGDLWLGTQRRVWKVAPGGVPVPVSIGTHGPTRVVQQIHAQDNGALWIPVSGRGIGYLRPDWRSMTQLTRDEGSLTASLYRGMGASESGVWMLGERGELDFLDRKGVVHPAPQATRKLLVDPLRPLSAVEDDRGHLWLGTSGLKGNLLRVDGEGVMRRWEPHDDADSTLGGGIRQVKQAPDGSIWLINSGHGVQQRDVDSGRVLSNIPATPGHGLGAGNLTTIDFDADGVPWVAGDGGVVRLAAEGGRFEPVPGLEGDHVFAFVFDGPDRLWLQRLSGLERYRRSDDGWERDARVGMAQGIPAVEGMGLHVDTRHRVWLPTSRGLYRWDHEAGHLRHFGLADGLSSHQFVNNANVLTADGVLVGALDDGGVALVDTRAEDLPPVQPRLHWDGFDRRHTGNWLPVEEDGLHQLTARDRELRAQFRLLAFDNPEAIRYFTRLDGYDSDWVAHGSRGEREFAGLDAGEYTLRARAMDAAGNASAEQTLHFTVLPPWWKTRVALLGFAGLAVLLLWWLVAAYLGRLRQRHAHERAEHEREVAMQASLAKTRFLATLGHEVRTPMTGVLGMSELLLGTRLDSEQRQFTRSIKQAGEHLLRLVNDALDLARIESGKLELVETPFELERLVADVTGLNAPLARDKGLDFISEVDEGLPLRFRGDAKRITQILLNLLGNAIKFTETGHVALRVGRGADDALHFTIEDTGPGLNEEQQQRLFRRFEQAEGARTASRYGGSGLGLAISQELVGAMGGRIEVDSAPGRGTRFRVRLPLPVAAGSEQAEASSAALATPARSLAVLLVEDDPTVAEVMVGLMQASGHRVNHAEHGLAALAEATTAHFDAALLDLDLPGMDGFALARQLRAQGFAAPLVAITARADAEAETLAMQAGFDRFMRKPVTGEMLARMLDKVVGGTG